MLLKTGMEKRRKMRERAEKAQQRQMSIEIA